MKVKETGTDSGHVIGFKVVDHVLHGMPESVGSWKEFARGFKVVGHVLHGMPVSIGLFCSLLGLFRHPH